MERKHVLFLLLVLLYVQCIVSANHLPINRHHAGIHLEKAALLAFKKSIISDPQAALSSWINSTSVCDFTGVRCNKWRLHVVILRLNRTGIQGTLSPFLANLTGLHELDLSDNQLSGHIPQEFSSLRRLTDLDLSGNLLDGPIPESLADLSGLGFLNLGSNCLIGQVPPSIFLNGTYLNIVDLSNNALFGEIPIDIGNELPELLYLNLYSNGLTGNIPKSLSNSSYLYSLDVENNHLSGELPSEIVCKLRSLKFLHLSYNNLSSHDNNSDLVPFFDALSNCTSLMELEMAGNGLGGHLPHQISKLTLQLSIINLDDNRIYGQIPSGIASLAKLTLLNLSNNLLSGKVPDAIGLLPRLERLFLSNNLLEGGIPSTIGNVSSIGLLDLSKNNLRGEIPASLGNLSRLSGLFLHQNQLSGAVPSNLGQLKDLNILDLSYNKLEGGIPKEIAGLAKIFLNLSNNRLQGALPLELSKMQQVQEIDLSSNNLTGDIIPQLSSCIAVGLINLSHNSLQGWLPESFGDLRNLETLDVSFNSLTGEIPLGLSKCTSLTQLNLSYNDFHGYIPLGGIFSSFNNQSFLGNPHLCGSISDPICSTRRRWNHTRKFLIMVCIVASTLAFLATLVCVIGYRKIRKIHISKKDHVFADVFGDSLFSLKSTHPRITHKELVEATDGFNQERLLGTGGYGRVYRGTLSNGTIVAIKVLQLQTGNSTKSFSRECQVLKRIRHRNLMRIITACSLPDFKALVLPFMANGSLESHLYLGSSDLSLVQRVSICSDIAEGMAYLHHHSPVRVIHCDLKPSNVLLNDDLTALVSDFGISRLAMTVGVGSSVATLDNVGNSTVNMLCGSIGYIAPEYGYGSSASTKGDVYSFGVLVLEVVTRRRPTDEMFEGGLSLHRWVKSHYHGRAETVVDPSLTSAARDQTPEIKKMWEVAIGELLELGLLCTQESPSTRPTMLDAADDLNRLKRYLAGDSTATFSSSLGIASSTFGED